MNKDIIIYADLDAFYDYRRALLQCLMTKEEFPPIPGLDDKAEVERANKRKAKGDEMWDKYISRNYKERRFDTFSYPGLGIDKDKFKEAFDKRSVEDWATGMFYPTALTRRMFTCVMDIENIAERPIEISSVKLFVNVFPYQFDEPLLKILREFLNVNFKGMIEIKTISSDQSLQDAAFYGQYNYVFRYNLLLDESSKALMDTFTAKPIPETSFIVPDIQLFGQTTFEGDTKEWMFASFITLGPALKLLPIEHSLYDYME